MRLSTKELQELRAWFRGVGSPDLRVQDKNDIYMALDELLAYREGYDPAEVLPEDGQKVLVRDKSGRVVEAIYCQDCHLYSVLMPGWAGTDWAAPVKYAVRWFPMPGGE